MSELPRIAITMGDPAGIGPELALRVLDDREIMSTCAPIIIGSAEVLCAVAEKTGVWMPTDIDCVKSPDKLKRDHAAILDISNIKSSNVDPGTVSPAYGRAACQYIEQAVELCRNGTVAAMVTGPINKDSLNRGGTEQPGHTELLAKLTGTESYAMMQYSPAITVSFVTTHAAIKDVPKLLTVKRIVEVGTLTAAFMKRILGWKPLIGVCALNPHAGENGLFGTEENTTIAPAIACLKERGILAEGPLVPDTAFIQKTRGRYDAFVTMYHDQGHIPFKMLSFHSGVNVTLGLPIIRTSVDHGTAFDIAWQGKADPGSMRAAVLLASRLVG